MTRDELAALRREFEIISDRVRKGQRFGHNDSDHAREAIEVARQALEAAEELRAVLDKRPYIHYDRAVVHVTKGTPAEIKAELGRLAREEKEPS